MTIFDLKEKSGAKLFASIIGKSTISKESREYNVIYEFTKILLENGFGIIHGGYAGGAMSAASEGANEHIRKHNLSPYLNIAVPQKQHDGYWERVKVAQFADAAEDIFNRLKMITIGDVAIIAPLGGHGTELEESIIFHENVLIESAKVNDQSQKIKPMVFFQTENGTDWKKLIQTKLAILDISGKNISDYQWLYFVNSLEQFKKVIQVIKEDLTQKPDY